MAEIPEPVDKPGQLRGVLRTFFSNPWIGFLGSICSVVGVGLAIYFYFGGARTRRLTYSVNPVKTVVVKSGEASTLRVLHGDQDIKGDVTAAQVAVWNHGSESIRAENVLSPVCITLQPPVPVLEARIGKVSRPLIGAALDTSRLGDGLVPVTWKTLEHNDGAVIQWIFAGPSETDIELEGVVEGQPRVSHLELSRRVRSPTEQLAVDRRLSLVMIGLVTLLMVASITVLLLQRIEMRARPGGTLRFEHPKIMWVNLAMVSILLLVFLWRLRQPGPPFGF
jgi:hypothetical protein